MGTFLIATVDNALSMPRIANFFLHHQPVLVKSSRTVKIAPFDLFKLHRNICPAYSSWPPSPSRALVKTLKGERF